MAYVYMVKCVDGTFYTGWTVNLEQRLQRHNAGKGARYTRARRPVSLIYWEACSDRSEAQKREAAIKKLDRAQKERLVVMFREIRSDEYSSL
ncbi:MAG: GIY-YIG nuclease family protein [Sporomusaceae bacterium]|nr:GIY-YIG nuclease family protein [Sporomusaceae bacterium]